MLDNIEREIFHKILNQLGIELKLRSWRGGPPDKKNASSNIFQLWSKSTDRPLLSVTIDRSSPPTYARLADNDCEAARFLLEECVGLVETMPPQPSKYVPNPVFGCANLEAAAMKLSLLTDYDWLGNIVEESLDEDRCKELIGKLCHSLGWRVQPDPDMPYVMLDHKDNCAAYGRSWLGLFICFSNMAYGRCCPFSDNYPKWALEPTASLEELAVKIDLNCS